MPKLPILKPKQVVKMFEKLGFRQLRQKGSHVILRNQEGGQRIVVPLHVKDMPIGTLRSIIRQSGVDKNDFLKIR